jgi:hypothetical protein
MDTRTRISHSLVAACLGLGLVHLTHPAAASAQYWTGLPAWSAPGATGVVDESSTTIIAFDTPAVGLKPSAPASAVAVLRYPVGPLPSQWGHVVVSGSGEAFVSGGNLGHLRLTMTFQKPDEGAYAAATLKRVSLSDGAVTSIASVNTGSHIPGPAIQAAERIISCAETCFVSSAYAYYVEVVVWKAAADSQPRVLGLRVQLWP